MLSAAIAILVGFVLLVWSADRFVDGAAATARHAGMPPLVIGMVIVGFGTSAPEMVVSAMAALDGNPDLALGNAIGSNICNIGLILGITALIAPFTVHSKIIRRELPLSLVFGLAAGLIFSNGLLSRFESTLLVLGFFALVGWTLFTALLGKGDTLAADSEKMVAEQVMTLNRAIFWLVLGLALLVASSRILVWGAVTLAQSAGVSELVIGLTIVALGTSLPELAASVVAARKGEHDIAIGNVVGSNMFNLLAVVGIAGVIHPIESIAPEVMTRDWPAMIIMTLALFALAYGFRGKSAITRGEGCVLLLLYMAYNAYLVASL